MGGGGSNKTRSMRVSQNADHKKITEFQYIQRTKKNPHTPEHILFLTLVKKRQEGSLNYNCKEKHICRLIVWSE